MSANFPVVLTDAAPARRFLTSDAAVDGVAVMRLAAAGEIPVGVTGATALDDGAEFRFTVEGRPVWQVEAGEAITPGAFVESGADGRAMVAEEGDPYAVAMALDAGVAPSGETAGTVIRVAPLRTVGLGGGGSVAWADVTGKPSTFAPTIGTTATTAVAGNDSRLTAGAAGTATVRAIGTTATTAAAGNHSHTAANVSATAISPGTATDVQGILAELAARVTALEAG